MLTRTRTLCFATAAALLPALASASSFTVDPLMVELSARRASQVVTLTNQSNAELRFEVKAFKWDHDEHGQMSLEPTSDVVLFPSLITVKPGEKKNVRVGMTAKPGGVQELSYRLFIEELPPAAEPGASGGSRVAMRTRVGIPVFVLPAKASPKVEVTDVSVQRGHVQARLRNTGNVHVMVDAVEFTGASASGTSFQKSDQGWYLLPGRSQLFDVALTPNECQGTTTVRVRASIDTQNVTSSAPAASGGCVATP